MVSKFSLLVEALRYADRGWAVIPTKGKTAACKWKKYQSTPPDNDDLRGLFNIPGITGLAVIHGSASGGIACRDFDNRKVYMRWKSDHPDLADMLPTVRTARGFHVYFRGPESFEGFPDGEYRGDSSHITLLPPSLHPDGPRYEWVVPLPKGWLPKVDPCNAGLVPDATAGELKSECNTENTENTENAENTGNCLCSLRSLCCMETAASYLSHVRGRYSPGTLFMASMAIESTQPEHPGVRHRQVFNLCRRLKRLRPLADLDAAFLRPFVQEWHRLASPVIATKEFSETWADFLHAWQNVKHPAGHGAIEQAFAAAQKVPPPRRAVELYGGGSILLAASLCRELQRLAGDADFFLDCRTLGRLLRVEHTAAWRHLKVMCSDRVLDLREVGSRETHRASSYRYLCPLEE